MIRHIWFWCLMMIMFHDCVRMQHMRNGGISCLFQMAHMCSHGWYLNYSFTCVLLSVSCIGSRLAVWGRMRMYWYRLIDVHVVYACCACVCACVCSVCKHTPEIIVFRYQISSPPSAAHWCQHSTAWKLANHVSVHRSHMSSWQHIGLMVVC